MTTVTSIVFTTPVFTSVTVHRCTPLSLLAFPTVVGAVALRRNCVVAKLGDIAVADDPDNVDQAMVKTPAPPCTVTVTGVVVTGTVAPRVDVKPEPKTLAWRPSARTSR